MRITLQARRWQVVAVVVLVLCLLALMVAHSSGDGAAVASVLFFPVFLFGLLDPRLWMIAGAYADDVTVPQAPVRRALFQRPPPSF